MRGTTPRSLRNGRRTPRDSGVSISASRCSTSIPCGLHRSARQTVKHERVIGIRTVRDSNFHIVNRKPFTVYRERSTVNGKRSNVVILGRRVRARHTFDDNGEPEEHEDAGSHESQIDSRRRLDVSGGAPAGTFSTIARACVCAQAEFLTRATSIGNRETGSRTRRVPTSSNGCREFFLVQILRPASSTAMTPRPRIHNPAGSGTPPRETSPSIIHGRNALAINRTPADAGM